MSKGSHVSWRSGIDIDDGAEFLFLCLLADLQVFLLVIDCDCVQLMSPLACATGGNQW